MGEEINERIQELTRLLEEQRVQLTELANTRQADRALPVANQQAQGFDKYRIPDLIKIIPTYDREGSMLATWLESVEQKIHFAAEAVPNGEILAEITPLWTGVIRDKIVGKANEALVCSHTPLVWAEIKSTLKEFFGDKRDLSTLLSKIPYLRQSSRGLEEFYHECRTLLSDINAKITLDDNLQRCAKPMLDAYESMITTSFVDGLNDPISALVRTSRPPNLLCAYQNALDQHNAIQRRREKFPSPKPQGYNAGPRPVYPPRPPMPNNQRTPFPNNQNKPPQNYQARSPFHQSQARFPQIKQEPSSQQNIRNAIHFQETEEGTAEPNLELNNPDATNDPQNNIDELNSLVEEEQRQET